MSFTFKEAKKPAGFFLYQNTRYALPKKPNWFYRKAYQFVFGWKWVDYNVKTDFGIFI